MCSDASFKDKVGSGLDLVQLEEKRFLEAARRSIQTAMGSTGAALRKGED